MDILCTVSLARRARRQTFEAGSGAPVRVAFICFGLLLLSHPCAAATCRDFHDNCMQWMAAGECEKNPVYMRQNCAMSCESCESMAHDCSDIGDDALEEGGIAATMKRLLNMTLLQPKLLSSDPYVVLLEKFVDASEAADVIRVGGHNFSRSLAGNSGQRGTTQSRTSSTSWCNVPRCEDNEVMWKLKRRITFALGCPMENTEHLQVLRYEPGQYYRAHHDQNCPNDSPMGPRVFTFFLYLSDVERGGETHFPQLDLTVTPRSGSAIVWPSVRDDDIYRDDPRTEHEARTVEEGVKYAANFWVHLRDFQTPHNAGCGRAAVESAIARKRAAHRRAAEW
eukprot:CAMPEP_0183348094 /NCGR_PEP_ID=MMETSP0164_2-20130417/12722_1 /TAXON_ID=221442 /ORGANISM="Coccolithus pelagicus ssp braarudi, Strain PLY182g" /LENGTH=337 /DNA_ID=CAMNT_0025519643 /DNA_START=26 /DNA_END=1036 /DNA_ORIENTATION=-